MPGTQAPSPATPRLPRCSFVEDRPSEFSRFTLMQAGRLRSQNMKNESFPEIPLEGWRPTKNTLHRYFQIVVKIRHAMHPRINHWWHVPLYVSPRGLIIRTILTANVSFEIEFDLHDHCLVIRTSDGRAEDFAIFDGLSVGD